MHDPLTTGSLQRTGSWQLICDGPERHIMSTILLPGLGYDSYRDLRANQTPNPHPTPPLKPQPQTPQPQPQTPQPQPQPPNPPSPTPTPPNPPQLWASRLVSSFLDDAEASALPGASSSAARSLNSARSAAECSASGGKKPTPAAPNGWSKIGIPQNGLPWYMETVAETRGFFWRFNFDPYP